MAFLVSRLGVVEGFAQKDFLFEIVPEVPENFLLTVQEKISFLQFFRQKQILMQFTIKNIHSSVAQKCSGNDIQSTKMMQSHFQELKNKLCNFE